ncbi:MGMT family protein [Candidatus Falkowbacteria bacterium]|nr:MGMT family protein [Candidatus Falkowbacteria bacterium]
MTEFEQRILDVLKMVPKGKVTTYAELARGAGYPNAARAVGNALNKNPQPVIVPCHRVVLSSGKLGGYAFGVDKKMQVLAAEGVIVKKGRIDNFKEIFYKFK